LLKSCSLLAHYAAHPKPLKELFTFIITTAVKKTLSQGGVDNQLVMENHYHIIITFVITLLARVTCAGVLSFLQQKESTKESAALANRSAWPK
jgi:hypothetical protein